ncbi:hypothetical protein F8M41_002684 [Gigaspora margarita]|uniref:Uncharacterized protein n=1 Tax=Gigaspora margarita TaxID=4874 RepID=A0A8H4AYI1_GIGMA|nr:hypothetical protein F8M41_002684 [Gigaspora margarita]
MDALHHLCLMISRKIGIGSSQHQLMMMIIPVILLIQHVEFAAAQPFLILAFLFEASGQTCNSNGKITKSRRHPTFKSIAPQVESGNNITEVDKDDEAPCPKSENNSVEMSENDEVFDPEMRQTYKQKVKAVKRMADHLEQELAANNFNYITRVINNMDRLFTMLNDIETAQNRRRHNRTWRGSTLWTLYLQ